MGLRGINWAWVALLPVALMASEMAVAETAKISRVALLRKTPSLTSAVMVPIPAASTVEKQSCQKGWCRVEWRGRRGYVPQSILIAVERQVRVAQTARMFAGPGERHRPLSRIPVGSIVSLNGCAVPGWCEVTHVGVRGWVSESKLSGVGRPPRPLPPVTASEIRLMTQPHCGGNSSSSIVAMTDSHYPTRSVEIRGARWLVCDKPHYGGTCRTIAPGCHEIRDLRLRGPIRSARPDAERPVACTLQIDPVCARKGASVRTFDNGCLAKADGYQLVDMRQCR